MSFRRLGALLQLNLKTRSGCVARAELLRTVELTKNCHISALTSHVTTAAICPAPYFAFPRPLTSDKEECLTLHHTHLHSLYSLMTRLPLPRLAITPFSIATATPTRISTATTITTPTFNDCPAPTPLPTAMELSSVLKKRRSKINHHKYKKWRKKHRFLRRRLGR